MNRLEAEKQSLKAEIDNIRLALDSQSVFLANLIAGGMNSLAPSTPEYYNQGKSELWLAKADLLIVMNTAAISYTTNPLSFLNPLTLQCYSTTYPGILPAAPSYKLE